MSVAKQLLSGNSPYEPAVEGACNQSGNSLLVKYEIDCFSDGHVLIRSISNETGHERSFLERAPHYLIRQTSSEIQFAVIVLSCNDTKELIAKCAAVTVADKLER